MHAKASKRSLTSITTKRDEGHKIGYQPFKIASHATSSLMLLMVCALSAAKNEVENLAVDGT
jgi:hypothetical protein